MGHCSRYGGIAEREEETSGLFLPIFAKNRFKQTACEPLFDKFHHFFKRFA